jgi:AraC family transcriptional regulator
MNDFFATNIRILDYRSDIPDFPERLENRIYLSSTKKFNYDYESPFSVKYVDHGSTFYKVNGVFHKVKKHQVLIINNKSEVCSGLGIDSTEVNKGLSIFLDPRLVYEVFRTLRQYPKDIPDYEDGSKCGQLPVFYNDIIDRDAELISFFKKQYSLFLNHPYADIDPSYYYTTAETVLKSQMNFMAKMENIRKIKASTRMEILKRVLCAKEIMDDANMYTFDLDELARSCALSKFFLIKCFRQVFHTTPNQYFIMRKIEKAKELLAAGKTVSEVSYTLNYPNIFSFSRQFRLCTDLSPSKYKIRCGKV